VPPELEPVADANAGSKKPVKQSTGVVPGSWPAESTSPDLSCQRALLAAAAEVRAICRPAPGDSEEAWRCDVHLDGTGPLAVVRVRSAVRGSLVLPESVCQFETGVADYSVSEEPQPVSIEEGGANADLPLRCSLVVPSKTNAFVLEVSLLDYFAYTDRAVALEVTRDREYAAVREGAGPQSPEGAKRALHLLHKSWLLTAGCKLPDSEDPDACVEVSPLLSYEGEGLVNDKFLELAFSFPCHLPGPDEVAAEEAAADPSNVAPEDVADGLDTRLFYLQEYPQRLQMSHSHAPQFRTCSRGIVEHLGASATKGSGPGSVGASAPKNKKQMEFLKQPEIGAAGKTDAPQLPSPLAWKVHG